MPRGAMTPKKREHLQNVKKKSWDRQAKKEKLAKAKRGGVQTPQLPTTHFRKTQLERDGDKKLRELKRRIEIREEKEIAVENREACKHKWGTVIATFSDEEDRMVIQTCRHGCGQTRQTRATNARKI